MNIVLSETLSYCFGVRKTLELTEHLLTGRPGRTYYMLGEIVHNEHVVEALRAKGLHIVQTLEEVPAGGVVILQSHGSTRKRYEELAARGLDFVDATCPMVRIIHDRIRAIEAQGRVPVVIGQVGHEEVRGIVGQVSRALVVKSPDEVTPDLFAGIERAGVVAQSTFIDGRSPADLRAHPGPRPRRRLLRHDLPAHQDAPARGRDAHPQGRRGHRHRLPPQRQHPAPVHYR